MKKARKLSISTWLTGHVNWFDPYTNTGSITGDDGNLYHIQDFSKVEVKKLKKNSKVEFEFASTSVNPIIKTIRSANTHTRAQKTPLALKKIEKERSI